MHNFAANFWNSMTGTGLYCVWVRVHDDGGDRLVSRWIDPATDHAQITTSKNDVWNRPGCYSLVRRGRDDVDLLDAEDPQYVLPLCSRRIQE